MNPAHPAGMFSTARLTPVSPGIRTTPVAEVPGEQPISRLLRGPVVDVHDSGPVSATALLPKSRMAPADGAVLASAAQSIDAASLLLLTTLQKHGQPELSALNGPPIAMERTSHIVKGFLQLKEQSRTAAARLVARLEASADDVDRGFQIFTSGRVSEGTRSAAEEFLVSHRTLRRGLRALADLGQGRTLDPAVPDPDAQRLIAALRRILFVESEFTAVMGLANPAAEVQDKGARVTAELDLWREELRVKVDGAETGVLPYSADTHTIPGLGSADAIGLFPSAEALRQLGLAILARTPNLWSEAPLYLSAEHPTVVADVEVGKPSSSELLERAAAKVGLPHNDPSQRLPEYSVHLRAWGRDFVGVFTSGKNDDSIRLLVDNRDLHFLHWDWANRQAAYYPSPGDENLLVPQVLGPLTELIAEKLPPTRGDLLRVLEQRSTPVQTTV